MKRSLPTLFVLPILVVLFLLPLVHATDLPYNQSPPTCYGPPITDTINCYWDVAGSTTSGADGFGAPHNAIAVEDSDFTGLTVTSAAFWLTAVATNNGGAPCPGPTFIDAAPITFGTIDTTTGALIQAIGTISFSSISAHLCDSNGAVGVNDSPVLITVTGSVVVGSGQAIGVYFPATGEIGYSHYVAMFCSGACDGTQLTSPNSGIVRFDCGMPTLCDPGLAMAGNIVFSSPTPPNNPSPSARASTILGVAIILIIVFTVAAYRESLELGDKMIEIAIPAVVVLGVVFLIFAAVGL